MIFLSWPDSGLLLRVSGEGNEVLHLVGPLSEWYPDKYPSPYEDGEQGQFVEAVDPKALALMTVVDVTPQEAFSAMHGLGLPEERECTPSAVAAAFEKPIRKINAQLIRGTNRSILHSIVFEDGTTVHLGSGASGAVVYRISKPRLYTKEVLDGR